MKLRRSVRAVLLDVDGTLYHQNTLRAFMALELSMVPLAKPSYGSAAIVWKIIRTFRQVREELRELGAPEESLTDLQYMQTAKRENVGPTMVKQTIAEWIYQRPLKYIRICRRRGVDAFFAFLGENNIPTGVFSDYPVREKLTVLGLSAAITPALCATDPDINAFKPHPKGFLRACAIWGLPPDEVLYVGDRFEIDGAGATAAGLSCAILGNKPSVTNQILVNYCLAISSFKELQHALSNSITR